MAVELAKVSLWLKTISKEKPLSFLDHRLKQGNSLIGARLEKLHEFPDLKAKKDNRKVDDSAQQKFEAEIEPFLASWTYIGVDIEKYPSIKKHLEQYRQQLENRWDKGNFWYELIKTM